MAVDLVLVASSPNPFNVLVHPLRLEGAGDNPDKVLFRFATTFVKGPIVRYIVLERGILDGLHPNILVRKLGPSRIVDLYGPHFGEDLLLEAAHLLEEAQGGVLL